MLAGCTSSTVGFTPSPSPSQSPGVSLTIAQQNYEANAALAILNSIRIASRFAGIFNIHTAGPRVDASPLKCVNGVESRVTFPTPENIDVIRNVFYDKLCKHPLEKARLKAFIIQPKIQLTGKLIGYAPSGKAVAYGNIAGLSIAQPPGTKTTLTGTISLSPSAPPVMAFGLTCTINVPPVNACTFGALTSVVSATQELGFSSNMSGFVGTGDTNAGKVTAVAFAGAPNSLKLSHKGGAWIVTGGTKVAQQRGTFSESIPKSLRDKIFLNLKDSLNGAFSTTLQGEPGVTGFVNQTSSKALAASFDTSPAGFGTIRYSDGSTGKVVLFIALPPS